MSSSPGEDERVVPQTVAPEAVEEEAYPADTTRVGNALEQQFGWPLRSLYERARLIARQLRVPSNDFDDVVQGAIEGLSEAAAGGELKLYGNRMAYLRTSVRNAYIDHLKARETQRAGGGIKHLPLDETHGIDLRQPLESERVERVLLAQQNRSRIEAAMQRLTPQQRQIVRMWMDCEHNTARVAKALGVPYSTIRSQVKAALKDLRVQLHKHRKEME